MKGTEILDTNHISCDSSSNKTSIRYSFTKPKCHQNSITHKNHSSKITCIRLKKSRERKLLHELFCPKVMHSIRNENSSSYSSYIELKSSSKLKKVMHYSRECNNVDLSNNLMDLVDNINKELLLKHKRKISYCSCRSCSALQAQNYYIKQKRHKNSLSEQYSLSRSSTFSKPNIKNKNRSLCLKAKTIKSDPCTYASEIKENLKRHSREINIELQHRYQKLMLEQPPAGNISLNINLRNDVSSQESISELMQRKEGRKGLKDKTKPIPEEKLRDIDEKIVLFNNKLDFAYSNLSLSWKSDSDIRSKIISTQNLKKSEIPKFSIRDIYYSKTCEHIGLDKRVPRNQSIPSDYITYNKKTLSAITGRSFQKRLNIDKGTYDNIQIKAKRNKIRNKSPNITSYIKICKNIISKHSICKQLCKSSLCYVKENYVQELSQHSLKTNSMFNLEASIQQNKFIGLQEKVKATNIHNSLLDRTQSNSKMSLGDPEKITELPTNSIQSRSQTVFKFDQNKDMNLELCDIFTDTPMKTISLEPITRRMKTEQIKPITPRFKPTKRKNQRAYPTKENLVKGIESERYYIIVRDNSKNKKKNDFSYKIANLEEDCKADCDSVVSPDCSLSNTVSTPHFINSNNHNTILLKSHPLAKKIVKDSKKLLVIDSMSRTFSIPLSALNPRPVNQIKPNKEANMLIGQYLSKQNLQRLFTKSVTSKFHNSKSRQAHHVELQNDLIADHIETTQLPLGTNNYNPVTRSFFTHDSLSVMKRSECKENKIKCILKTYFLKSKIHKIPQHDQVTQCKLKKSAIDTNKVRRTHRKIINGAAVQQKSSRKMRRIKINVTPQSSRKSFGYPVKRSCRFTHALKNKRLQKERKVYGCNYNNHTLENVYVEDSVTKKRNVFLSFKSEGFDHTLYMPSTTNTSKSKLKSNDKSVTNCFKNSKQQQKNRLKNEYLLKSRGMSPSSFINCSTISGTKQNRNIYTVLPVLLPYECEPAICVPGECDPYECYKRIKKRHISQSSGTEKPTRRTFGSSASGPVYKATKSQAVTEFPTKKHRRSKYAKQNTRLHDTKTFRYAENDGYDSVVRVGSSISFNIEFYKSTGGVIPYDVSKPSKEIQPHKAKVKTHRTVVRPSRQHKEIHMPKTPLRHHKLQTGQKDTKGTGVSRLKKSLATVALQKNEQLNRSINVSMEGKLPIRREVGISKEESLPLYKEVGISTRRYTPIDEGIRIRRIKDTGTKPLRPARISASNMTCMDPKCRSTGVESMFYTSGKDMAVSTTKPQIHHRRARFLPKGITRFGSNVTLNLEFYKERVGDTDTQRSNIFHRSAVHKRGVATIKTDTRDAGVKWTPKVHNRHAYTKSITGYNEECQAECTATTGMGTGSGIGTFLKRCFCTLNFSIKQRTSQKPEYERRSSSDDKYVSTKVCDLNTCDTQVEGIKTLDKSSLVYNMIKRCFCTRKFFNNQSKLLKLKSKMYTVNRASIENVWNDACRTKIINLPSKPNSCVISNECISRKDNKFVGYNVRGQSTRGDLKNKQCSQKTNYKKLQREQTTKKIEIEVPYSATALNEFESCARRELKSKTDASKNRNNIIKTFFQNLRIKLRKNKNSLVTDKNIINTANPDIPTMSSTSNDSHKMSSKNNNITNFPKTSVKFTENTHEIHLTKNEKEKASYISNNTRDEVFCDRKSFYRYNENGDELKKNSVHPCFIHHYGHPYKKGGKNFPYADHKIVQMALVHKKGAFKKNQDDIKSIIEKHELKSNKNEKQIQTLKENIAVKNNKKSDFKKADKSTQEVEDKTSGKNKNEMRNNTNKNVIENQDKLIDKIDKNYGKRKSFKIKRQSGAKSDKNNIKLLKDKPNKSKKQIQNTKMNKSQKVIVNEKEGKNKKKSDNKKKFKNYKEIRDMGDVDSKKVEDTKERKNNKDGEDNKPIISKKELGYKSTEKDKQGKFKNAIDAKNTNKNKKILNDDNIEEFKIEKVITDQKKYKKTKKKSKSVNTGGKNKAEPILKSKELNKMKNIETCTCVSKLRHKEFKKSKLDGNLIQDPCVCGVQVSTLEFNKTPGDTCQCDIIMAERNTKEMQKKLRNELHKRQESECDAKKQKTKVLSQQNRKQKEISKRNLKKEDDKKGEKFKKLDNGTLVAESILAGLGASSIKGIAIAAKLIKNRTKTKDSVKELKNKLDSNSVANYIFNIRKSKKRVNVKKKRPLRKRERQDFECSLLMASLRRRPCLFVYDQCPWCYPQCLSFLYAWRQCVDIFLFLLAVGVWSPFILVMETCRALMCCLFCTG